MIRKLTIIALVVVLALLIGVATLPAHVAWRMASAQAPNVQLSGLSGTLWQGHAEQVVIASKAMGTLDWQIPASKLLVLTPTVQLKLAGETLQLEALAQKQQGNTAISALVASADASWLAPALGIPAVTPTGKLAANFGELLLDARGLPLRAKGNLQWLQAGVTGLAQAEFGSYDIALENNPAGGIKGVVRPIGDGALSITGEFALHNLAYQAEFTLRPNDVDPASSLARALTLIGEPLPGAEGARILKINGTLVLPK
jgi:general secretion pathway protein N